MDTTPRPPLEEAVSRNTKGLRTFHTEVQIADRKKNAGELVLLAVPFHFTALGETYFNGQVPPGSTRAEAVVRKSDGIYTVKGYQPRAPTQWTNDVVERTFMVYAKGQQLALEKPKQSL